MNEAEVRSAATGGYIVFTKPDGKTCCRSRDVKNLCRECAQTATAMIAQKQGSSERLATDAAVREIGLEPIGADAFAQLTDAEKFRVLLAQSWGGPLAKRLARTAVSAPPDPWEASSPSDAGPGGNRGGHRDEHREIRSAGRAGASPADRGPNEPAELVGRSAASGA